MQKHLTSFFLLGAAALATPASAQAINPTQMQSQAGTADPYKKPQPQFSEMERQVVVDAAVQAKSRQKTPKGFSPNLGGEVPREVNGHGFQPEVVVKLPVLKEFQYAYLDREIILINALEKKIVAVVPLPAQLISETTGEGGATNPDPADPEKAKAYTSPQTTK